MDLSEQLRRLYNYLGSLDDLAQNCPGDAAISLNLQSIATGIRNYVDAIAEEVGYLEGGSEN